MEEFLRIINALEMEVNIFEPYYMIPKLAETFSIKDNKDLDNLKLGYLMYTNIKNSDYELIAGINYYDMQNVLKCNNNIYFDCVINSGHYYTGGNFNDVQDSLTQLDMMLSKIIHTIFNNYPGEYEYENDYTYTKILNCFLPNNQEEKSNMETEKSKPFVEILQNLEDSSRNKIYEEFYRMEKAIEEYKLKENERKHFNKLKQLQKEKKIKEMEEENEKLKRENKELIEKMNLLNLK
jgi:hypothetical protein